MFRTTLWSDLESAAAGHDRAVESFVARYRPPVVDYLRRQRLGAADAEDLAQEVFVRLFAQNALERADSERGRFRTYLLGLTHNVLLQHWRSARALKRGGGADHVPFELAAHDLAAPEPEVFQRCWQEHVLRLSLERVASEHPRHHDLLARTLRGQTPAEIAAETEREASVVRVDLHRARKRLAEVVREELARTVATQEEYEEEIREFVRRLPGAQP